VYRLTTFSVKEFYGRSKKYTIVKPYPQKRYNLKTMFCNFNLKQTVGIGLCSENVSMAKRAISWAMFINILIVPMIIGLVLQFSEIVTNKNIGE